MDNTTYISNSGGMTPRQAAVNGLAVVGFIALLVLGIGLAIYSTRYLASFDLSGRLQSASVYLSSLFQGNGEENLEVVPTLTFGDNTALVATTTDSTTDTDEEEPATNPRPTTPVAPRPTTPVAPYGLPDLAVTSIVLGYLTTNSTDSFVASTNVPSGMRPALRFVVTNIGTNVSGTWHFNADLPTSPTMTYTSDTQQGLRPGERIQYVLGFDRPQTGSNKHLTIRLDAGNQVAESNETNNAVMPSLDIF